MHVTVTNQNKPEDNSVMCVERDLQTCIILRAMSTDTVQSLEQIARAMGAPEILVLLATNNERGINALKELGWSVCDTAVLLGKELR